MLAETKHGRQPFSLILLDAQMPDMDGFAVADAIGMTRTLRDRCCVMLTSSGLRVDAARCRELGVEAYLAKPIGQAEACCATVGKVLGPRAGRRSTVSSRSISPQMQRRLRVLVAEDDAVDDLAVRLLEKGDARIMIAATGTAALEALENQSFDLVLMDMQMPRRWAAWRPPSPSGSANGRATSGQHYPDHRDDGQRDGG